MPKVFSQCWDGWVADQFSEMYDQILWLAKENKVDAETMKSWFDADWKWRVERDTATD